MKELEKLIDRIIQRVNIDLRELAVDVGPHVGGAVPTSQMLKFYAFYGITSNHPLDLVFRHSNLAGSYFLGRIGVADSVLYKSDIRGDELKKKGSVCRCGDLEIALSQDERIDIAHSFLVKTLVHCFSHDPETPEVFFIRDTVSLHYADIHGSPLDGCLLGPFSTVDLTTMRDCVLGAYAYVQAGEIGHLNVAPGTVWVRSPGAFNFLYRYPLDRLSAYVSVEEGRPPRGELIDFVEERKEAFQPIFDTVNVVPNVEVPDSASLDRYAVTTPDTCIKENVLVAQRAFLENAWLGRGANAQENCYIVNSSLAGYNVTAHGAKIVEADLEENVFVGFNSFLRGRPDSRLRIGGDSIMMPHTIIDLREPLSIPERHLVWGLVTCREDLERNSMPLEELSGVNGGFSRGDMFFEGSGSKFVEGFRDRILHILEANGAFFDGERNRGHAQQNQKIARNTLQPYAHGELEGLYPTVILQP